MHGFQTTYLQLALKKKVWQVYIITITLPCSQVLNIIENHHCCYHMSGLELAGAIRVRATNYIIHSR